MLCLQLAALPPSVQKLTGCRFKSKIWLCPPALVLWSVNCISRVDLCLLRQEAVQGCVWIWPSSLWTPLRQDCRVSRASTRQGASGASTLESHLLLSAPSPTVRRSLGWLDVSSDEGSLLGILCSWCFPRGTNQTKVVVCVRSLWDRTWHLYFWS